MVEGYSEENMFSSPGGWPTCCLFTVYLPPLLHAITKAASSTSLLHGKRARTNVLGA